MAYRIGVKSKNSDTRAESKKGILKIFGFSADIELIDVYTIDFGEDAKENEQSEQNNVQQTIQHKSEPKLIEHLFANPITQEIIDLDELAKDYFGNNLTTENNPIKPFDWLIEIGFLPGVTDNVGMTAKESIDDFIESNKNNNLLNKLNDSLTCSVYTSQIMLIKGDISAKEINKIAEEFYNPIIQRAKILSFEDYSSNKLSTANKSPISNKSTIINKLPIIILKVKIDTIPNYEIIELITADENKLSEIGKNGIIGCDGKSRGPLALDLICMKAIQEHFKSLNRNPTDVELESIAQTWSEHCKHTIFSGPIDEIKNGLFKEYIQRATEEIKNSAKHHAKNDICVSVFKDNSGAITFDDDYLITFKVETHNSPSALDPFGGAITGILGVNRDCIGFGKGAKPVINTYGFCLRNPNDDRLLYRNKNSQKMLSSKRILDGVVAGINAGGNCSGIPTPQGFIYFDERYAKPLVFAGTVGLIPKENLHGKLHEKKAMPGDYIVMVGGKVGKDGVHGATFSSQALDAGSPATAVQIGDPITQKKLSDVVIKEARDLGLYNSITDNGAGGLSCSVAEMANESNGCHVELDKIPLKYDGLDLWEIWISESQERMTLAIPKEKWQEFNDLMIKRKVEATIIGKFTDSGKCVVEYNQKKVMELGLDFLHNGLPKKQRDGLELKLVHEEPEIDKIIPNLNDLTVTLHCMLERHNLASFEFISLQYDHEVQGGSVIKPLQGKGKINGDTTITRPLLDSKKGIVLSHGINPNYSDIDTYHMTACSIDTAIRNAICAGANINHLAILDNFCWCSSEDPYRLNQLKSAAKACYNYAVAYGTPFISGKDSMFNDFNGFDENGNQIQISIPPTLLISSIGVIDDAEKSVSMDVKFAGDLIYVLGETFEELGGSEYFAMLGEKNRGQKYIGNNVPKVNAVKNKKIYSALTECIESGIISSCQSVNHGGLGIALAKMSMAGGLGIEACLENLPGDCPRNDYALYSESQGRVVLTIAPKDKDKFEELMDGNSFGLIGKVRGDKFFLIYSKQKKCLCNTTIEMLLHSYKSTMRDY